LEAVFVVVASTANVRAAAPVKVPPLVKYVPAVRALATCVAVVAVVAEVAVEAFPLKAAVIVPAEKLPDASRKTIVEAVFAVAAVIVAEFAWLVIVHAVVAVVALPDNAPENVPAISVFVLGL